MTRICTFVSPPHVKQEQLCPLILHLLIMFDFPYRKYYLSYIGVYTLTSQGMMMSGVSTALSPNDLTRIGQTAET